MRRFPKLLVAGLALLVAGPAMSQGPGQNTQDNFAQANLDQARAALAKADRTKNPQIWADAKAILGTVLLANASRDIDTAPFYEALKAFSEAQEIFTPQTFRTEWAGLQRNTGLAHLQIARRSDSERDQQLQMAKAAFTMLLSKLDRMQLADDWASAQNDLGLVLHEIGRHEANSDAGLKAAVDAFEASLSVRDLKTQPLLAANTLDHLASTLQVLGGRQRDKALLQRAIKSHRNSIQIYGEKNRTLDWAAAQDNLSVTLRMLARLSAGAELEEALMANAAALTVYSFEQTPFDWAIANKNRGVILADIADLKGDASAQVNAIAAYDQALRVFTKEEDPSGWVDIKKRQTEILRDLAIAQLEPERLKKVIASYEAVCEVVTREIDAWDWAILQTNRGDLIRTLGEVSSDKSQIDSAIQILSVAWDVLGRKKATTQWVGAASNLARAYEARSRQTDEAEDLERAAAVYAAAVEVATKDLDLELWARLQTSRAAAAAQAAEMRGDMASLVKAAELMREVIKALPAGHPQRVRSEQMLRQAEGTRPT
jgi:hypothetical protein